MKTVTILLSLAVNDHNIVHLADYQTNFTECSQAEQAVLDQAHIDYIDTGKAHSVMVESCVTRVAIEEQVDESELVVKNLAVTLAAK